MLGFQEGLFYTELISFGVMTDKANKPRFKILSLSCTHTAELRTLTPRGSDYKKQKFVVMMQSSLKVIDEPSDDRKPKYQ
jgi:hypothetical protein